MPADLVAQVERALAEDIGPHDLTAELIPAARRAHALVITREPAVICGASWVDESFRQIDASAAIQWHVRDGEHAAANQRLFEVRGSARSLLTAERTALNFLQLLSGTATEADRYAQLVAGTGCKILDTRKTIPGLRSAQKYAVRVGGAFNHRLGLYDGILIKENHIMAAGSISAAVQSARRQSQGKKAQDPPSASVPVEVEVETLDELRAAISAGADIALLDEFSLEQMRAAVQVNRAAGGATKLEASGGITLETVRTVAETGVDFISIGAITKHLRAIDLSMRFVID